MPFDYPYVTPNDDVLYMVKATGKMQNVATFTELTTPTVGQVEYFIRGAAAYVVRRLSGAGYCVPLAPKEGSEAIDEPTQDLIKYLVALIAAGKVSGYHVVGDKGPKLSGYGAEGEMMLDDLQQGQMVLDLCSLPGSIASTAYQQGDIPRWSELGIQDTMSITAYAMSRIQQFGIDGTPYFGGRYGTPYFG